MQTTEVCEYWPSLVLCFVTSCPSGENHGAWSEAELKVLLTCLHQQLLKRAEPGGEGGDGSAVIQKMDLYKKLEWSRVAKQVQTRSWLHCKHKW